MNFQIGQSVVLTKGYGGEPVQGEVVSVSPSGKVIGVAAEGGKYRFRVLGYGDYAEGAEKHGKYNRCHPESFAETLQKQHDDRKRDAEIQRAMQQQRIAERQAEQQQKLNHTKAAFGGDYRSRLQSVQPLPDGTTLYTFGMPLLPAYADYKKFEMMMVRTFVGKQFTLEGYVDQWEAAYTFINAAEKNFASCSTIYADTEEDVIWECLSLKYFRS